MQNLLKLTLITSLIFSACTGAVDNTENPKPIPEVTEADWSKGNLESPVVLLEYSDFQCPACKARGPIIENLLGEFGDHIRFVYRHMPLSSIHNNAQLAAQATEAAGVQGKFWEMHDHLFETQSEWSGLSKSKLTESQVLAAGELGINKA